ncbi:putative cytochrome c [Neospora caninum Liverpool]|uniref:Cytochrome c, putative n=1 Tax=Neospora caninum (strain Liverpool) TaxID=572307 RepID=F0VHN6_NEOCL|nr:putative cytochrome c [Neospora caninum Liverpool]CBZ53247.1 putative cytochrome c [Neospora caninum Liverpool]CEL67236.1 TPA: cytochrome c, putative [Neospora caninum Liverpool]|eukprot:XP_003883279.1 putative cytochrome c [Neospora caninum Liverpool]
MAQSTGSQDSSIGTGRAARPSRFVEDDEVSDGFVAPPGDAVRGAKLFKKHCAQCHSVFPDGRHLIAGNTSWGPTLWNVYMRTAGVEKDTSCAPVSAHILDSGVVWNDANLMRYMKNPKMFINGVVGMNFFGIANFQDRVDIIHYLRTLTWSHPNGKKILDIMSSDKSK